MSDRAAPPRHDKGEMPEKSMQPYQSAWMSHWMHPSAPPADEDGKSKDDDRGFKRQPLLGGSATETHSSKSVKSKAKMINFLSESQTSSPGKSRDEIYDSQFPMFRSSQDRENILTHKIGESSSRHEGIQQKTKNHSSSVTVWGPLKMDAQSRDPHLHANDSLWDSEQQVKQNKLFEKNSLEVKTPTQHDFLGSSSKIVPYELNRRRTPIHPFFHKHIDNDQCSATFRLTHDPSTSNSQLRDFLSRQFQKMPSHSHIELFHDEINPAELSKSGNLCDLSHAITGMPSIHGTMQVSTTLDSVEEFSRGPAKFSQTTHHFFIAKKTDINVSDGGQVFRGSTISTRFKGKAVSELLSLSPDFEGQQYPPDFGFHVKQGVKLQPLDSSTESDGKEILEDVKTSAVNLKNESSAETDAMDMDDFKENHFSGMASLASNEDIQGGQKSPTSQAAMASIREETKENVLNTELPDINQEIPIHPGAVSSADDKETSTSRTQSLDVEQLLAHAEHTTNSKSSACRDGLGLDPYSRWVKRLKRNASNSFAYGTKSSKMEEASSHEKVNKYFSRTLKCGKTSSESIVSKSCGQEHVGLDQTAELTMNAQSSSTDSVRNSQAITLSHAWIRRWSHNSGALPKEKPKAVAVCEPQSAKATLDDFRKKQFPSIAAMALMGKAMNGFHPCEFRKTGSFVVWNTKGY